MHLSRPARDRAAAALCLALIAWYPESLAAQVTVVRAPGSWVGAPIEEYARLLQVTGVMPLASLMLRPIETPEAWAAPDTAPWRAPWSSRYRGVRHTTRVGEQPTDSSPARAELRVLDPYWQNSWNSAIPSGRNDGAMWAGRGLSTQLTLGAAVRVGPLQAQLAPSMTWSQNSAFPLAPLVNPAANASPYSDPFFSRRIDRPQRFGADAIARIDPGQSFISLSGFGARTGWSSENMWWGPGIDDAIMVTNHAAGFNHVFVGTERPANVGIGRLELLYAVGWLRQSGFWRAAADTFPTRRWLNSIALVFEPKGSPGLYLGAARSFYAYQDWNPINPRELLSIFQAFEKKAFADSLNPNGNDARDQMLSLWLRWVFPQVGLELYGEYGRNDHNWDYRDAILEPDHSRGYQLGLRKVYRMRDALLSVRAEVTNLERSITGTLRPSPPWYSHHRVQQGYTQEGQVIGAGIGPGSDAQTFVVDWFERRGRIAFTAARVRDNVDALLGLPITDDARLRHDVYLRTGPRLTWFAGPLDVDVQYLAEYEFNRYLVRNNDVRNQHVDVRLQLRLP